MLIDGECHLLKVGHRCSGGSLGHGSRIRSSRVTFPATTNMPRLPRSVLLHRRAAQAHYSPSRLSTARFASPPQITAPTVRHNCFNPRPTRTFASTTPKHRPPDKVWPYLYAPYDAMPHLVPFFEQVDKLQETFVDRLKEAVAIPSISSEDERRKDVVKVGSCQ